MLPTEFFPTPDAVIEKMVAPLYRTYQGYPNSGFFGPGRYEQPQQMREFPTCTILDPSAGSGAILNYVENILNGQARGGCDRNKRLYCFETDATLQAVLQKKAYRLLGYDFLQYSGDMPIELILMNPPFSNGDQHILHAYKVVAPRGRIVALVNSETLRNPFSRTRQQLAHLIEQTGGSVEELGACFKDSERPTDVEVSLIRLQKPEGADPFNFDWENKSRERQYDTSREHQHEVAGLDVIGNMLTQYDCLREQFMALLRAIDGIKHYGAGLSDPGGVRDAWRITRDIIEGSDSTKGDYSGHFLSFTEQMREQIWSVVMRKVDVQKFMTEAVRANFSRFSASNSFLDFTRENVFQLVSMVLGNTGNILEVAIKDLFDTFTENYYGTKNRSEGWKTNSRWKVNRKLVLPNWVSYGEHSDKFEVDYRHRDKYDDVDKVMTYLTGEPYETTRLIKHALEEKFNQLGRVGSGSFDNLCYSKFFKIRFYKKGTIHLEFLDEKLHQEFNLRACAGKQWLPDEEQQAYQRRKSSPFAKAKPAPGTVHAELVGLAGEQDQLVQRLLNSPRYVSETTTVISPATVQMEAGQPANQWAEAEEAQVVEEATPAAATPKTRRIVAPPASQPAGLGQQLSFMEMAA